MRLQNISGKVHFIKSVTLEFVLEAEDKKTKQKSELVKLVSFTKSWIIGDQDFAFYEPMKAEVEEGNKLKIKRVLSCKISNIEYGSSSVKQEDLKAIPFEKETPVGLISPVLLKLKFFKSSDSGIGYYKRGLKSKTKPAVRVDCLLKYENSAKNPIKLKDDVSINFEVSGTKFKHNLEGFKLNKFEVISKNIFSIYFSNSVNPETMQIFLDAEKSQLLKQ